MPKCQSLGWATLIGAPEWDECTNEATVTLRFVPVHLRTECTAAGTKEGREEVIPLCDECRRIITDMLEHERDLDEGWVEFDNTR